MEKTDHMELDCLKIKHEAQEALQQELIGLSAEEELAFHRSFPLSKNLQSLWDSIPEVPRRGKRRAA